MTEGAHAPGERAGDRPDTAVGEDVDVVIWRLETELKNARRYGVRSLRQLHRRMLADVQQAERSARQAERRARRAERRAEAAERELAAVRASSTWRAGRVIVGVPARIKGWRKS